jgi:hypothetical protein
MRLTRDQIDAEMDEEPMEKTYYGAPLDQEDSRDPNADEEAEREQDRLDRERLLIDLIMEDQDVYDAQYVEDRDRQYGPYDDDFDY